MSKRLALELLAKVNNPSHSFTDAEVDEDGSVANVPQRIPSRHTRSQLSPDSIRKHLYPYISSIDKYSNLIFDS